MFLGLTREIYQWLGLLYQWLTWLSTSWGCDSISQAQFLWGGTWWVEHCRMHLSQLTFSLLSHSFMVTRILFGWLLTALISPSVQDTERISTSLSSKSNWFTESFSGGFLFLGLLFISGGEGACEFCADIVSSWANVASALRHISIHFSSVSSGAWNSFFLKLLSRPPQTILSVPYHFFFKRSKVASIGERSQTWCVRMDWFTGVLIAIIEGIFRMTL